MLKRWPVLSFFLVLFTLPLFSPAQEVPISEEEMVAVINSSYGKTPLYLSKDIPDKDLHTFDFNDDGTAEWVVVPATACGETKNCTFFIMQVDQKKKQWKLLLMADGKVTPLTPWGFAPAPRKTKNYTDLLTVFDTGPEASGIRSLEKHNYVWTGKKYEEFTGATYPPEGASPEMKSLMDQVEQLKYQRLGGGGSKVVKKPRKKAGPKVDVYNLPPEMQ